MKTFLVQCALAACALSATVATAQDTSTYACDPCCGFNGFYVGGNLGMLSHVANRNDIDGFLTDNSGWTTMDTSIAGGVQLGYDWQCCSSVFGLVMDWNASNVDSLLQDNPNAGDNNQFHTDFDWFTSLRARAGLAVDNALIYVSAGPAVAKFESVWQDPPVVLPNSDTRWGWIGTVGTEVKCSHNISVGAELFYMHFDDETTTFYNVDGFGTDYAFTESDSAWGARFLVNYRFGG